MGRNHCLFHLLKFTWKLGAGWNKAETLKIIYCGYGIELSFALEESWQLEENALSEEVHVKSSPADNCWHIKKLWLCSGKAWVRTGKVWNLALSFAELGTVTDLCCQMLLKSERREGKEQGMYCFSIRCVPKKCALAMWCVEGVVFKMLISLDAVNTKDNAWATFGLVFYVCSQSWKFH